MKDFSRRRALSPRAASVVVATNMQEKTPLVQYNTAVVASVQARAGIATDPCANSVLATLPQIPEAHEVELHLAA